jgi:mannose-6-phosphate isomerase-like protein (cupin superfamily)
MDTNEYINILKGIDLQPKKVTVKEAKTTINTEDKVRPTGFDLDVEADTIKNTFFRKVLYTAPNMQLVLMSVKDEIGMETHPKLDQFIRIEKGKGKAIINGREFPIKDGSAFIVPQGAKHNVINTGDGDLKLYTIYAPPNHPKGVIDVTREDAEKREKPGE